MITVRSFLEMFVVVYVLVVVFQCISRLTYHRDSPHLIVSRFRSILIRCLILTTIVTISMVLWAEMGWMPKKTQ